MAIGEKAAVAMAALPEKMGSPNCRSAEFDHAQGRPAIVVMFASSQAIPVLAQRTELALQHHARNSF